MTFGAFAAALSLVLATPPTPVAKCVKATNSTSPLCVNVYDAQFQSPVDNFKITGKSGGPEKGKSVLTDSEGNATLSLDAGSYEVCFEYYTLKECRRVDLVQGTQTIFSIAIWPEGMKLHVVSGKPVRPAQLEITEFGFLSVHSDIWGDLYINGKKAGQTPAFRFRLPAGKHDIRVVNPVLKKEKRFEVEIQAGRVTSRRIKLK